MNYNRFSTYRYINGNYIVVSSSSRENIYGLKKRVLRYDEDFKSEFPDSIDLKITNKCKYGCPFCHESSIPNGNSFDLEKTIQILSQLPKKPIEIAIGGGDVLECLDDFEKLVDWLLKNEYRPRVTLNVKDLYGNPNDPKNQRIGSILTNKIEGLGISISSIEDVTSHSGNELHDDSKYYEFRDFIENLPMGTIVRHVPYLVYHIILGIFPISELKELLLDKVKYSSVLILGYKQWGRAKNTKIPDLSGWREELSNILTLRNSSNFDINGIGFDNLACEQLDIKNILGEELWNSIYMGDEGTCSMYIDAVKGEFARTSRSEERVSWNDVKLLDFYASLSK